MGHLTPLTDDDIRRRPPWYTVIPLLALALSPAAALASIGAVQTDDTPDVSTQLAWAVAVLIAIVYLAPPVVAWKRDGVSMANIASVASLVMAWIALACFQIVVG